MRDMMSVGVSPGTVAVHHSTNMKEMERRVKIAELVLRCVVLSLSLLAALLVATDTQTQHFFSLQKKATFTDMKALLLLVVANVLASVYSLTQGLGCVVRMMKGSVLFSKPLAWLIFSADQVMAYVMVAAVAAAVQSAVFAKVGQPELQWMSVCNMYGKFCNQVGGGIASAFVASTSMVVLSCVSAFTLFRLYGGRNKISKINNAGW